ncbi:MAG TPA: DUF4062 domain-containing protein, partial [Longimicrobiaceae bacterium]|nr:DUF4062 domain-containing protein [Longimicrobiaceae bacterium]
MASLTPTVFLSSRFAEFQPIRQAVKDLLRNNPAIACTVVDLGENYPHDDPPLLISQDHARSSDIMVLLVGPDYGDPAPGQKRSYVHLEYEAACGRNSKASVLAYLAEGVENTHHPGLGELYRDIDRRQTWSRLDPAKQPSEMAFEIVQHVQRKAFSLITTVRGLSDAEFGIEDDADEGAAGDAVEEDRRIENDPHLRLEPRPIDPSGQVELLAHPARAAADEQKREAARALDVGEWRRAVWHLDQARQRQPWDLPTLFWGARLKLISGRRDDSRSGLALAARATRVAEKEIEKGKREIPLAACHMLAARAASQMGDTRSGVEFAGKAVEFAKWYWLTYYELARQQAHHGSGSDVAKALRSA